MVAVLALSPTGDVAASGGYADFGVTKEELDRLNEMAKRPISVSTGIFAHGLGGSLRVWDLRTGRLLRMLAEGKKPFVSGLRVHGRREGTSRTEQRPLCLRLGNPHLDQHSRDGRPVGQAQPSQGGDGLHPAAPISADGRRTVCLDVACPSQPLLACDLRKARWRILDGGKETIGWLGLSPDGTKVATADWQGQLAIRDFDKGTEIQSIKGAAGKSPSCVRFSPDGKRLALGDEEGYVSVWEAETGRRVGVFEGPKGRVRQIVFVAGGLRIVSGGVGSTKERDPRTGGQKGVPVMIWDARLK